VPPVLVALLLVGNTAYAVALLLSHGAVDHPMAQALSSWHVLGLMSTSAAVLGNSVGLPLTVCVALLSLWALYGAVSIQAALHARAKVRRTTPPPAPKRTQTDLDTDLERARITELRLTRASRHTQMIEIPEGLRSPKPRTL
jgi:hypothetical protein